MTIINTEIIFKLNALIMITMLVACSSTPVNDDKNRKIINLTVANLPEVAAEFRTIHEVKEHELDEHNPRTDKVTWRFWRENQKITIERPQVDMGELWQRDGQSIIHRKLYHADHRAIEFRDDDLRILGSTPIWQKLALLLDPNLLAKLMPSDIKWFEGYPVQEYQGKIDETDWHIIMRMDLGLPILIERQHEGAIERTELTNISKLSQAPWQPTPANGYEIIDFSDLGDKEYDPFVIKVQSQVGHIHHH